MDARSFGAMEAKVEQLHADVAEVKRELAKVTALLSEARGGWRTLMWLGGACAAVGAALMKLAQHWLAHVDGG